MILIFSSESDFSTGQLILWLRYFKKSFIRINETDKIILKKLTHNNLGFEFDGKKVSFADIDSIWYRRGNFNINLQPFKIKQKKNPLKGYVIEESLWLSTHIHNLFSTKKAVNNYNNSTVNKLDVLRYCQERGLNTSNYIITQSKQELLDFYKSNKGNIISKAMNNPYVVMSGKSTYSTFTYKVKTTDIQKMSEIFTPTFFQSQLDKKYEVRTFYLEEKFYSMAIFSQKNKKTNIDFRHYDWQKPNRLTPFRLPLGYRRKISKMLKHFKVNCASLDTIVSKENKYFMLDINPIGQFGMISKPCNYNIERLIAEYLA